VNVTNGIDPTSRWHPRRWPGKLDILG
jgi:hypothetical protein